MIVTAVLATAVAAATPVPSKSQLRGHLPELGERPAVRVFQTQAAYESFRQSLGEANVFPATSSLFMSFDRDILALYIRGNDSGGRCLQTGTAATLDSDNVTLDLSWQNGTCGAPITAHYPFILVSLARAASDGSQWIQPSRSICAAPPGVDRTCAATAASPSPTASAATTPVPTTSATTTPTPVRTATPTTTAQPTVAATVPSTPSAAPSLGATPPPVAAASPPPAVETGPNYPLIGALGAAAVLLLLSWVLARPSRRRGDQ
jgi:hypothetical protein